MSSLQGTGRIAAAIAGTIILVGAGSAVLPAAQSRDPEAAAQTQALRELVGEVRALRGVIENYTQGQARVQTTTELLAIQQRRSADATARLDTTRRELDTAILEGRTISTHLAELDDQVRLLQSTPQTDPKIRQGVEFELVQMKQAADRQSQQEQQLRTRESELVGVAGLEEAKWNDLVEQVTRSLR